MWLIEAGAENVPASGALEPAIHALTDPQATALEHRVTAALAEKNGAPA
jgi:hypothetical protein